nr:fibronectin type III domain-containing protein [Motilibacter deserti]
MPGIGGYSGGEPSGGSGGLADGSFNNVSGSGGGGASVVEFAGWAVFAAGGGGAGSEVNLPPLAGAVSVAATPGSGGNGGASGGDGTDGEIFEGTGFAGKGAAPDHTGAGGGQGGQSGALRQGGKGGGFPDDNGSGGGGGGGGFFGGGGGGYNYVGYAAGGGGGGSNYAVGDVAFNGTTSRTGNGFVSITFNPCALPAAPTAVTGTAGDASVTLTWSAPSDTGGQDITKYEITPYVNGVAQPTVTTDTADTTFTVPGLTNGTAYTFTVAAVTTSGTGAASEPSQPLTPLGRPSSPRDVELTPGNRSAVVTFTAPATDGGSPITGYEYSWREEEVSPLSVTTLPDGRLRGTITGLTNGTPYRIFIRALNAVGAGLWATGGEEPVVPAAPAAPGAVTATAGVSSVIASWTAANADNITGYTAYANPGPATCSTSSAAQTSCVLGATAGTPYTVTVVAHTAANGDSDPAGPSNEVTPTAPPVPVTPPATDLTLTTDRGAITMATPGQQITVLGTGFAPYSTARVTVYSDPIDLGSTTTDAHGNFALPVTVPASLPAGGHTFIAAGVAPDGTIRTLKLPVTVPPTSVGTSGPGVSNQTVTVPVPSGGGITLLDASGNPATVVTIAGQGTYALDTATGTISFVAAPGFSGTATSVRYRVTDATNAAVIGTYTAVVTAAAPVPAAPAPTPPAPAAPAPVAPAPVAPAPGVTPAKASIRTGKPAVATGTTRRRVPVTCVLSTGRITGCTVTLTAKVSGRQVVLGTGKASVAATRNTARVNVPVTLNALGRSLSAQPGGTAMRVNAVVTRRGVTGGHRAYASAKVVAKTVKLARVPLFGYGSSTVKATDRRWLASVRRDLGAVKTVTCIGYTDSVSSSATNLALGKRRANSVCSLLVRGTAAKPLVVTRGEAQPRATNNTPAGRAKNRRTVIILTY